MRRLGWMIGFWVVVVAMGSLTPYVWRNESVGQRIGWLVLLVCSVLFGLLMLRLEVLLRRRKPGGGE